MQASLRKSGGNCYAGNINYRAKRYTFVFLLADEVTRRASDVQTDKRYTCPLEYSTTLNVLGIALRSSLRDKRQYVFLPSDYVGVIAFQAGTQLCFTVAWRQNNW